MSGETPEQACLKIAREYGFEGNRLPWFGVFVVSETENTIWIMIITPYRSEGCLNEALERYKGCDKNVSVYYHGDELPSAGFVPN